MKRIFMFCVLAAATQIPAAAQMVIQAQATTLQPQISRDQTGFNSCGIRALVIARAEKDFIELYDFSLMIRADVFFGTLKAGKSRTTMAKMVKGVADADVVMKNPVKFWIAKENEGKALVPIKVIPSETKGFILEIAEAVGTLDTIVSIANGERLQFAVRYKDQPLDVVISFASKLPENEYMPLLSCIDGVLKRLQDGIEEKGR